MIPATDLFDPEDREARGLVGHPWRLTSSVESSVHLSQQVVGGVGIVSAMVLRKNSQLAVPIQEQDSSLRSATGLVGLAKDGLGHLAKPR